MATAFKHLIPYLDRHDGPGEDHTGMLLWDEDQWLAWVSFGIAEVVSALYWMQHWYTKFWSSSADQY